MLAPFNTQLVCPIVIGRSTELAYLHELVEQAHAGRGQVALLSGEAGIGKSRLIAEVKASAVEQGFLLLQGNCFPTDLTCPYAPFLDLFRSLFASPPPALDIDLQAFARDLFPLLPDLVTGLPPTRPQLEPEQEKRRLFAVMMNFFARLTARQPVLLVGEDIHWSDDTSLEFLHQLARSVGSQSLLVLGTYRNDEVHPRLRRWLAQMDRERLSRELQLKNLSRDELDAMLTAIFEQQQVALDMRRFLHGELLDSLVALTEGNPFFTEEILTSLISAGTITYVQGYWNHTEMHEVYIPRSVQDAVQRRTEQLNPSALDILTLAAVAGRRFDFTLLQSLTAYGEEQLLESMKELVAAQLVVEESADQFAFRHALTRQAIYKDLLVRERKRHHLAIAETLEQLHAAALDAQVGALAYHFYQAMAWTKAVDYARLAGEQALMLYTSRSAIDYFSWALDAVGYLPAAASAHLYRSRGQAHESLGEFEAAQRDYSRSLEAARRLEDRGAEWQSMLDLGFLWAGRDYGKAEGWFRQALSLAQMLEDPALQARSLNRIGNWHMNVEQPLDAQMFHQQALRIFEDLDDAQGIAETLDLLGMTSYMGGDLVQGTIYCRQAIACFEKLNDRAGLTSSLASLALGAATYQTDTMVAAAASLDDTLQDVEYGLKIAQEIGQRSAEAYALFQVGLCRGSKGEFTRALDIFEQALRIAEEIGHRQWQAAVHIVMGGLYQSVLAFSQAREHFEQALEIARDIKSQFWTYLAVGYLVSTYVSLREYALAENILAENFQIDTPAQTMAQRLVWCAQGELELASRNPQRALEIVEHLQKASPQAGEKKIALRVEKLRGEALVALRRYADAEVALCVAREVAKEQGARPVVWRLAIQLGHLYREQSRRDEAGEAFSAARELIGELALTIEEESLQKEFLRQATALLPAQYREESVSTRQEAKKATGGLTPREYEIAVLISKGKSNQELADALIVTKRTIETHIGNIMFKLEVNTRVQIAAWVLEKGSSKPEV